MGDAAYEALVKLSRCIAPPLSNWALDIATALRVVEVEESHCVLDLISTVDGEELNKVSFPGLFNRVVNGFTVSCKYGPLPVDTFIFVFPVSRECFDIHYDEASTYCSSKINFKFTVQIMEWILLSPKKTVVHHEVLRVLYLHTDPILPLPRLRMLSVMSVYEFFNHCASILHLVDSFCFCMSLIFLIISAT